MQHTFWSAGLALAVTLASCSQSADTTPPATAPAAATTNTVTVPGIKVERDDTGRSVVTTNDADHVTITGNHAVQTRALTGQDVQLSGDDNQATFTGSAKELTVVGNTNTVTLESVKSVQVTGDHNTIYWRGPKPAISNVGTGNVIEAAH